jgi:cholesterol transport system auxiliary component
VKTIAILLSSASVLWGCSSGLHSDARPGEVYVLRPAATAGSSTAPGASSIRVARPDTAPGLASDHIVLLQSDHRMSHYVASRWAAPLPELVEDLAVETLRGTGSWSTVQDSRSFFSADYMLQIVVRRFEADYTAGSALPEVHVVLDCTLGRRAGREIVASFTAEGAATPPANRLGEVVSAFELAANKAMSQAAALSYQSLGQAQNAEAPVPSSKR